MRRIALAAALVAAACRVAPSERERDERARADAVERVLASEEAEAPAPPPPLGAESSLDEVARYAVLRSPEVRERFWQWRASIEEIVVARSLEDPRFELEIEIGRALEVFRPGGFGDFPGPGKRALAGEASSRAASALRHEFEEQVLATAVRARLAWLAMAWLAERIEVQSGVRDILREIDALASARFRVGAVSQQDLLRVEIERDQLETEIASLEDARARYAAILRAALGVPLDEAPPPWPARWIGASDADERALQASDDELVARALEHNHRLAALEEELGEAEALVALARKARRPDFMAGVGVDLEGETMVMPELGLTLPIRRERIAAEIAAALARRNAAREERSAAALELVSEIADAHYRYRDAGRRLALLRDQLLPKAELALEAARAAYQTGLTDMTGLLDAERTLFEFRVQELGSRFERETARSELLVRIAGTEPVAWEAHER